MDEIGVRSGLTLEVVEQQSGPLEASLDYDEAANLGGAHRAELVAGVSEHDVDVSVIGEVSSHPIDALLLLLSGVDLWLNWWGRVVVSLGSADVLLLGGHNRRIRLRFWLAQILEASSLVVDVHIPISEEGGLDLLAELVDQLLLAVPKTGVFPELLDGNSVLRVLDETPREHISRLVANGGLGRDRVLLVDNLLDHLSLTLSVEGVDSEERLMDDAAKGPDIDCLVHVSLPDVKLRSHVQGGSQGGGELRGLIREPEISDFVLILVDEDVLWLHIPVNDVQVEKSAKAENHLVSDCQGLVLRKTLFWLRIPYMEFAFSLLFGENELGWSLWLFEVLLS